VPERRARRSGTDTAAEYDNVTRNERGESLIEILVSIVVMGLVVSALLYASITTRNATKLHRDLVSADTTLRYHAEATKAAVRVDCGGSTPSTYDVTTSTIANFPVTITPSSGPCPSPTATPPATVAITVTTPSQQPKTLNVAIQSP
jgi:hypothetical protein